MRGVLLPFLLQSPLDQEIGRALKKVFSDPDFPWSRSDFQPHQESFFLSLLQQLWSLFKRLESWLDGLRLHSPTLFWILFALLVLILILLLIHIGRTLAMGMRFALARPTEEREELRQRKMRSNELRARARAFAKQGQGAEAIRYLLLSLLAFLEEKHILQGSRAWTNRELFQRLEAKLPIKGAWEPLEWRVEQVSYAGQPLSLQSFEEMEQTLDALLDSGTGESWNREPGNRESGNRKSGNRGPGDRGT